MELNKGFYIGRRYFAPDDNIHEIRSPYNNEVVSVILMAGEKEREIAVQTALDSFGNVSTISANERIEILKSLATGIEKRKEEIAKLIAMESGKPIKLARAEIQRSLLTIDASIDMIKHPEWEHMPLDTTEKSLKWRYGIVQRFPVGVVLGITPFNFPINLVMHKLAPAIASGCPFILKPASQVASTALILGEILQQIGLEEGQVTIIPMTGKTADPLASDDRIKLITFTGSAEVGWSIKARAMKTRVSLELGGNAGCIVEPDADLDWAVNRLVMGSFSNQGQVCISTQRIYVHADIYENFKSKFVEKTLKLKMGDPLDESTDIGPMITLQDAERASEWVIEAIEQGAKLLCGKKNTSTMFEPTILENPPDTCRVMKDEIFAPVVSLIKYADFSHALNAINDTKYGLQAGIFTRDLEKAYAAFRSWNVGGVIVNDVPTFRVDSMPYGGSKDSGIGREGPRYAIEEMTEIRLMVVNQP
jgi:acyl-CoA reductase-like NAD-dependent aldehyde dehydrogenase